MTLGEYRQLFDNILDGSFQQAPYDEEDYQNYVKLNKSRMARWDKQGHIDVELGNLIQAIDAPQTWVVITEPWCGDAANSIPLIEKMAAINPHISVVVQLRDSDSEIDQYLTNGGKSIPIVVGRDAKGEDLFVWGPRPAEAQALVLAQKADASKTTHEKYAEVLQWYRQNKGVMIQEEFEALLKPLVPVY